MDSAKRVMNGTWGEVWLDGDYVSECYGLQAKVTFNKEDISLCGQMAKDKKVNSISCTGSLKLHKVNSRMALAVGDKIKAGEDLRFTVFSALNDPDAYGAERILIKNVSFDDLTLADWEAATNGKVEVPFSFTDYEMVDEVKA